MAGVDRCRSYAFLSTLSLRRATRITPTPSRLMRNFYPRSPCGERLRHMTLSLTLALISIHALLAESDPSIEQLYVNPQVFLSTLSLRRATEGHEPKGVPHRISIHALLAESDVSQRQVVVKSHISIHALLAESDAVPTLQPWHAANFYPRSPCGERPRKPVRRLVN